MDTPPNDAEIRPLIARIYGRLADLQGRPQPISQNPQVLIIPLDDGRFSAKLVMVDVYGASPLAAVQALEKHIREKTSD